MSEITKTKDQKPKTKNQIVWFIFALVVVFIYFFGLTVPLVGPDEPRYSQVAREMFERGDWVTPTLGGFDWFEKPALLYWLQITFYNIFGVSEFAARFGSALFGLGTIFSLWILGKTVQSSKFKVQSSNQEIQNPKSKIQNPNGFANWLALIAASSIGLIVFSRGASFDIILTFPVTASLCCYFLFETFLQKHYFSEATNPVLISVAKLSLIVPSFSPLVFAYLFLFGFYFFIGLAILAKGLIGIVFPLAIVLFYHILKWELLPSPKFLISLLWGILLSLLVASAWYLPMYYVNGWKFIDEFFIQHHFQRYTSNKYQHPQPFWFFFVVLPLMTIPWLLFFFAAMWNWFKVQSSKFKAQSSKKLSTQHSALSTFAFAWFFVPVLFFSFSGSKLPGYVLPALPGALILTALFVYEFVQKSEARKLFVKGLALTMFLVIAAIIQFILPEYAKRETVEHLVETANRAGYANEKIANLYTINHNLEFYGAGRTVRGADGKQKRYDNFSVLVADAKREPNGQILVLVPEKDVPNILKETALAEISILDQNGEEAIALIKVRNEK
jgi:4-amino-4-deoxy-L-arabinose transferase-like glycosyltransferase